MIIGLKINESLGEIYVLEKCQNIQKINSQMSPMKNKIALKLIKKYECSQNSFELILKQKDKQNQKIIF